MSNTHSCSTDVDGHARPEQPAAPSRGTAEGVRDAAPDAVVTLDAAVQNALRYYPADLPDDQRLRLREDLRLQFDYPGRCVAYVDVWAEQGGAVTLTRHVLATGSSYEEVSEATRGHPLADQVVCDYVNDPAAPVEPILAD